MVIFARNFESGLPGILNKKIQYCFIILCLVIESCSTTHVRYSDADLPFRKLEIKQSLLTQNIHIPDIDTTGACIRTTSLIEPGMANGLKPIQKKATLFRKYDNTISGKKRGKPVLTFASSAQILNNAVNTLQLPLFEKHVLDNSPSEPDLNSYKKTWLIFLVIGLAFLIICPFFAPHFGFVLFFAMVSFFMLIVAMIYFILWLTKNTSIKKNYGRLALILFIAAMLLIGLAQILGPYFMFYLSVPGLILDLMAIILFIHWLAHLKDKK